jgi:hypothetical protein
VTSHAQSKRLVVLVGVWFAGYGILAAVALRNLGWFPPTGHGALSIVLLGAAVVGTVFGVKFARSTNGVRPSWRIVAAAAQVVCGGVLALGTGLCLVLGFQMDPSRTDSNVAAGLHRDPRYPLVGYWKTQCNSTFGMAIDRARPESYTIAFCWPGRCMRNYPWQPDVEVNNVRLFRAMDEDTIVVSSVKSATKFVKFVRCQ